MYARIVRYAKLFIVSLVAINSINLFQQKSLLVSSAGSEANTTLHSFEVGGHLLSNMKHKVLLCYIQKNGCTSALNLMMKAAGQPTSGQGSWHTYFKGPTHSPPTKATNGTDPWAKSWAKHNGQDFINSHFSDEAFARIIIIRDPAERLLSGYLDKCKHKSQRPTHCLHFKHSRSAPTFKEFVMALDEASSDTDGHFKPQSHNCGLLKDSGRWNVVLDMSDPHFARNVRKAFLNAGIDSKVVNQFYPEKRHSNAHSTNAREKMRRYYGNLTQDNALLQKVGNIYRADYEVLTRLRGVNASTAWVYLPTDIGMPLDSI